MNSASSRSFSSEGLFVDIIGLLTGRSRLDPHSPEIYHEIVGKISIGWALLEMALDLTNEMVMKTVGPPPGENRMPASLKTKVRFFRKAHAGHSILTPLSQQADALADRVMALKELRHDVIHGIAANEATPGIRTLQRFIYNETDLGLREKAYSVRDLMKLSTDINRLGKDACLHGRDVADLLDPGNPANNFAR